MQKDERDLLEVLECELKFLEDGGGMPLTNMNRQDVNAIVAYIRSLPAPASGH